LLHELEKLCKNFLQTLIMTSTFDIKLKTLQIKNNNAKEDTKPEESVDVSISLTSHSFEKASSINSKNVDKDNS